MAAGAIFRGGGGKHPHRVDELVNGNALEDADVLEYGLGKRRGTGGGGRGGAAGGGGGGGGGAASPAAQAAPAASCGPFFSPAAAPVVVPKPHFCPAGRPPRHPVPAVRSVARGGDRRGVGLADREDAGRGDAVGLV